MGFHCTEREVKVTEQRYVRLAMTNFIHIGQEMCKVPAEIHLGPVA